MKLQVSKKECESVMSVIWNYSRSSPNGTAYKLWERMFRFVNSEQQELNFKAARNADAIDFFAENGVDIS